MAHTSGGPADTDAREGRFCDAHRVDALADEASGGPAFEDARIPADCSLGCIPPNPLTPHLKRLVEDSFRIIDDALTAHFSEHRVAARVILFSGGNDSTVLAHLMKPYATHAAHINTGIGIEETRQFVRDTCEAWGLPLIERGPDEKDSYRTLVLDQGFPGPAQHFKMYQRLKERGLEKVRNSLVGNPRQERVMYLAGRRREESSRRTNIREHDRKGSMVFVSPLANWTKLDLNRYRRAMRDGDPVPRNPVADTLHMSGECLCGAFATRGELDEIGMWFPDVRREIQALEHEVAATGKHPAQRCKWGWGAERQFQQIEGQLELFDSGPLCSSCDFRRELAAS
jgi:3'-phosphoadenosine 5'-phosphosulfate sulfotransferase (PAPS reductase)/FAD synthetase